MSNNSTEFPDFSGRLAQVADIYRFSFPARRHIRRPFESGSGFAGGEANRCGAIAAGSPMGA